MGKELVGHVIFFSIGALMLLAASEALGLNLDLKYYALGYIMPCVMHIIKQK